MKYVPHTEREGGEAWDRLEAAMRRYFEAEDAAFLALAKMAYRPVGQFVGSDNE